MFQKALGYCMLLPGPEAQQITTYVGWRLHGVLGGVVAGSFFIIPSIFVLLFFSWMSVAWSHMPAVAGFLYGIQPVVVAIVIEAVLKISKRTLNHAALVTFAVGAFIALQVIHVPFPLVILLAAFGGFLAQYRWPTVFHPPQKPTTSHAANSSSCGINDAGMPAFFPRLFGLVGIFFILWAIPISSLWLWQGAPVILRQEALFFSQVPYVTFGGAYAVLTYVAEAAVNQYQWLTTTEMIQCLGLAESTPGPLIMVLQYVAFVGAWKNAGGLDPLQVGFIASLYCTYLTFLPSFFLVFGRPLY